MPNELYPKTICISLPQKCRLVVLGNKVDLAVCSLVVGIFSILFCWCLVIPLVLSLIGLITGIVSLVRTNQHTGLALAGVIRSAIGLVLDVAILLLLLLIV